jgi:type IX secretion system substrate protein
MKIFLLIVLLVCIKETKAQTWVTIPDANFVTYLQSIIPSAMNGNQMNTSSTLVTTITHTINVQGLSIANLSGIQYFTSLTYLDCELNSLSNLPTLPVSLNFLMCGENSLTILPTLPASLTYLFCDHNYTLTSLPTLPTSLTYLSCGTTSLTSIPTLPNSLTFLECGVSNLTVLPSLPNSLKSLQCYNNALTSLPSLPNQLTFLDCSNNSLSNLPTLPNSIDTLACEGNNIACFPTFPHSIINIDIDPNPYNCLPNYITALGSDTTAFPLCSTGNTHGCAVAGIEQYNVNNSISVYPNPTKGMLNVELGMLNETAIIKVYNTIGECVHRQSTTSSNCQIDLSSLISSVYFINITDENGVTIKNDKLVLMGQ